MMVNMKLWLIEHFDSHSIVIAPHETAATDSAGGGKAVEIDLDDPRWDRLAVTGRIVGVHES